MGVSVLAYYPLAMGLLTGKLDPTALRKKKDYRSQDLLRYLVGGSGGTAGKIPSPGVQSLLVLSLLHSTSNLHQTNYEKSKCINKLLGK